MAQLTTTYISTRGEAKDATYSDIVLRGLATDGGCTCRVCIRR